MNIPAYLVALRQKLIDAESDRSYLVATKQCYGASTKQLVEWDISMGVASMKAVKARKAYDAALAKHLKA